MEDNNIDYKTVTVQGLTIDQQKIHQNNINPNNPKPLQDVYSPEQVRTLPSTIHGIKFSMLDRGDVLLSGVQGKDASNTKGVIDPKYLDAIYKVESNKLVFSLDKKNYIPVEPIHVAFSDHKLNQDNLIKQSKNHISDIVHFHNDPDQSKESFKNLGAILSKLDLDRKQEFMVSFHNVLKEEIPKLTNISPDKLETQVNSIQTYLSETEKDFKLNFSLTPEQKDAYSNTHEYGVSDHNAFLTKEQLSNIPDIIDGIRLSNNQKELLVTDILDFKDEGLSYHLSADNTIIREQLDYNQGDVTRAIGPVKESEISFINNVTMNTKNLDYLENQIKYLGFGEELKDVLTSQIENQQSKFSIEFPVDKETQKATYTLNFSKGSKDESNPMYFFNSFDVKLTNAKNEDLKHNFQVNESKGVTAKEAVNLLEGRSVKAVIDFKNKGEKEVFIQLDPKEIPEKITADTKLKFNYFSSEYGIKTDDILSHGKMKLPNENFKDDAVKALEKGNFVKVNFNYKGNETEGLVSLNAQYKSLDYYDTNQNRLNSKHISAPDQEKKVTESIDLDTSSALKR